MLHLVFDVSPVTLERLQYQYAVIFLNNSVLRLMKNSTFQSALTELFLFTPCYVLKEDLTLHGIELDLLLAGITPIDYTQFVELTVEHTPIQTWN